MIWVYLMKQLLNLVTLDHQLLSQDSMEINAATNKL